MRLLRADLFTYMSEQFVARPGPSHNPNACGRLAMIFTGRFLPGDLQCIRRRSVSAAAASFFTENRTVCDHRAIRRGGYTVGDAGHGEKKDGKKVEVIGVTCTGR